MNNLCISSLVVRTKPDRLASVHDRINAIPEAEVYGEHEDGRLVVVLDTADNRIYGDIVKTVHFRVR